MIYKVRFETNFGPIVFLWQGQEYVEIYSGADDVRQIINPFNYEVGRLPFRRDLDSFTDYCRWYLWEMERGIDIESIESQEVSRV